MHNLRQVKHSVKPNCRTCVSRESNSGHIDGHKVTRPLMHLRAILRGINSEVKQSLWPGAEMAHPYHSQDGWNSGP